jgi:phosphoglycolate phosphatase-like HAD superfamily hydrolase
MTVNGAIFDIDGTLVDSVDLHARAWQEALEHFGYKLTFGKVRHEIGKGSDKLIPDLIGTEEANRVSDDLDNFHGNLWKSRYIDQVRPFPKVRELFERILSDGRQIVLASSAKGDELKKYKQISGIDDLIEDEKDETSADGVDKSKPSPDAIHAALAKLGHPDPATVIMVGDAPWDVMAAAKAGVKTIAVLCGGFPEDELRAAGAIAIRRDPADLLAHYEESPFAATTEKAA